MNTLKKTALILATSTYIATGSIAPAFADTIQEQQTDISFSTSVENHDANIELAKENITYQAQGKDDKHKLIPGRNYSPDGQTPLLPYATGNPYNIKPGDTVQLSNFRRSDFPVCFVAFSCLFKPNYTLQISSVQNLKEGTKFTLNGFAGYDGHPVFLKGQLIGVIKGSKGGISYGYLFPSKEEAVAQQVNYKPLRTGLFTRAQHGSDKHPFASGNSGSSSSSRNHNEKQNVVKENNNSQEETSSSSSQKSNQGVDPREATYIAQNQQSWQKSGIRYLDSVKWNASTKSFTIQPKSEYTSSSIFLGLSSLSKLSSDRNGGIPIDDMWKEAVALGVPNIKSIEQQFRCHAQGSAIKKSNWNLEMGRSAADDQSYVNRFACNPPRK